MRETLEDIRSTRKAYGLKGLVVASLREGKLLGRVSKVFIHKQNAGVSGLLIRDQSWSLEYQYISVTEIQSLGEDIIFVDSKDSLKKPKDTKSKSEISTKDLQGQWVTTLSGKHLGQFEDAIFLTSNWKVTELTMSENKRLTVDQGDITFGFDEILVPNEYISKVQHSKVKKPSIFSRIFHEEPSKVKSTMPNKLIHNRRKSKGSINQRIANQKKPKVHRQNQKHA